MNIQEVNYEYSRSRNSEDKQYNYNRTKRQTMVDKTLHRKLKVEQHEPH